MREVRYLDLWGIMLTDEQYEAGRIALAKPDATHYSVFVALKEAGVPVRLNNSYPASQAATAFFEERCNAGK